MQRRQKLIDTIEMTVEAFKQQRYTKKSAETEGNYTTLCVELDNVLQRNMMEHVPKRTEVSLRRIDDCTTGDKVSSEYEVRLNSYYIT